MMTILKAVRAMGPSRMSKRFLNCFVKEINDVTCLITDHNLFLPLAQELGKRFKRVLYWKPNSDAFPTINKACVGDGFEEFEMIDDPWEFISRHEIDLAVFPDILDSGLQIHLEELGIPVWGSRRGDSIELIREKFLRLLKENGLEVPKFERVIGLSQLRAFLKNKKDQYLKISKYRGSMETTHWRSWEEDEGLLDMLAVRFGALREHMPFLVFESIDTDIEDGADSFNIDGKWPELMLHGFECKDRGYLSAVTHRAEMPDYIQEIMDVFSSVLVRYRYRNFFSMEVRVKDDKAFFIDPCCRGPIPASDSQFLIWQNLAEIIYHGANGILVEPQPRAKFTAECAVSMKSFDKHQWGEIVIPDSLKNWLRIGGCCQVGDRVAFPPTPDDNSDEIGWLVALGNSPKEVIDNLKSEADDLPDGLSAHLDALVELVQEADQAEDAGVHFTNKPMPEPAEVME